MKGDSKKVKDVKKTVGLENRWSTEAKQEGEYAKKRSKEERGKGNKVMAEEMDWDADVAQKFAVIRKKRANKLEKQIKK